MLTSNLSYISVSRHVIFQNVSKVVPRANDYACDLNPSLNSPVADKEVACENLHPGTSQSYTTENSGMHASKLSGYAAERE